MVDTFDIIFLTVQSVLFIVFAFQIWRNGRSANFLLIGMVFGIIATLLSIFRDFAPSSFERRLVLAIQLIFYSIEYMMVYLHFRGTISDTMNLFQIFSLSFIFGVHSAFGIYYTFLGIDGIPELIWDVSYNLVGFGAFLYVTYSLLLAYYQTRELTALGQVIAAGIIFLGFFISIFQTHMIHDAIGFEISEVITGIIKSVGILLILLVYIINPDYIERLPIQTYGIMAFDRGGGTISFHQIQSRGVLQDVSHESEASLITALTRAVLAFTKDALGTQTDLDRIKAEDKLILFDIGEEIGVAVIAERSTNVLLNSIRRCQRLLSSQISDEIRKGQVSNSRIKNIMTKSFPYIIFVS